LFRKGEEEEGRSHGRNRTSVAGLGARGGEEEGAQCIG